MQELFERYKSGDLSAKEEIVLNNLGLVKKIANNYRFTNLDIEDLIEEGNVGLMYAVEKFDHTRNIAFSTYASYWIKQCILRYIETSSRTIRIPIHIFTLLNKVLSCKYTLMKELRREPTDREIASKLNISEDKVRELLVLANKEVSMSMPIGTSEDELGDYIEDENANVFKQAMKNLKKEEIRKIFKLANLSEKEEDILLLRFGFLDDKPRTLVNVASTFNLTRQRINQIEARALAKLKRPKVLKILAGYLDTNENYKDYIDPTRMYASPGSKNLKLADFFSDYTKDQVLEVIKTLSKEDYLILKKFFSADKEDIIKLKFYDYLLPKMYSILENNGYVKIKKRKISK